MRVLKFFGIGIMVLFILSFTILFIVNPQTVVELKYLGITSFNLVGFKEQLLVALVNYILLGILIALFGFKFSFFFKNSDASKYGCYLIVVSGLAWASLGLFTINPAAEKVFGMYHMIRIIICWLSGIIGLVLISVDVDKIFKPLSLKWLSLTVSISMLLESIYLLFYDYSGVISAFAWFIYMFWFGYVGFLIKELKFRQT